jgi:putative ABC transport system permease protein
LNDRDVRIIEANLEGLEFLSPRRTLRPGQVLPKPSREVPTVYGVNSWYASIHSLKLIEGRFFEKIEDEAAAPVCVLSEPAKVSLLGYGYATGKQVKLNDNWVEVVGVVESTNNNHVYIPLSAMQYRYWDRSSFMKDDLDGVDIRLKPNTDSVEAARIITGVLQSTHRNVEDFTVTIPAALLAQQKRTQTIFTYVMVAIAAISLLVGGIGIMNIVLATVLERTREIGIRRATGARRVDIVRQFLTESVVISVGGGALGVLFGMFLAWLIAQTAEWRTIVTTVSVVIEFSVSVAVGVVFGIYPAM